ncbi:ABC transporter permease [bacterium]|nr:ABC transporter permease [bacterium]
MNLIRKLLISCGKEFLILSRDRASLVLLFLMPMFMVLVATLIQTNILEEDRRSEFDILLVNVDREILGNTVKEKLDDSSYINIIESVDQIDLTETSLKKSIARGDYQIGVIVHQNASISLKTEIEEFLTDPEKKSSVDKRVTLVFDPTIKTTLKLLIENAIGLILQSVENGLIMESLFSALSEGASEDSKSMAQSLETRLKSRESGGVNREFATLKDSYLAANAVQHNVPAWSMFGIFFIVLPLSGSIFKEREDQTLERLMTIPFPISIFYLGKIITYVLVNLVQLALMLGVGVVILPLLGTPALDMGTQPGLTLLVSFCAALAATGYGLLLGTVFKSYEQASVFGPISIVIAAALGGLMVPVFLMPKIMQQFAVLSPLQWGHSAFIDIFVRGATFESLLPNISRLIAFFLISLAISLLMLLKKN